MRPLTLFLALLLLAARAFSQAPPDDEPGVFGEVIDVRVVDVEVVVTDREGRRVTGLRPGDFRLEVDGKEVPVDFFTEVRDGRTAASGETTPAARAGDPGAPVGTSYLVFVDDYFPVQYRRDEVLQALRHEISRLGPHDRMGLVAWDGSRITLLSDWTGSPEQIGRAIDAAMRRPARGFDRLTELRRHQHDASFVLDDDDPITHPAAIVSGGSHQEMAYASTLSRQIQGAVSASVSALRAFTPPPGRKVLLLLSGGWPFSALAYVRAADAAPSRRLREGEELFRPLVHAANRLGYTLYPVDLPGLQAMDADFSIASNGNGRVREQEVEGTLDFLARETGGRAIRDGDRLQALSLASDDTRSYYWLGFTPGWKGDDKRHKIRVEVARPGVKVRARTGFLDLSRKAEVDMKMESALLFGSLPGSLPMPLKVGAPKKGKKRGVTEIPITLGLPVDVLTIVPVDGRFASRAELRLIATGTDGTNSEIPVIPLDLKSDKAPKAGGFVRYETKVLLRGKASRLVVALYDPLGEKVATAEADIPVF